VPNHFHRLLQRQLRKTGINIDKLPCEFEKLLTSVNESYMNCDDERKMLERSLDISSQELLQINSEMQAIYNAFPDIFIILKEDGTILNSKIASQGDCIEIPERLNGKNIRDFMNKEIGSKFVETIKRVKKERTLINMEYSYDLTHKTYHFEARLQPLLENQVIIVIRDITDRIEALEDLRKSEERYALAAEGANDGLWDWDLVTDKIYFSKRWKSMLGCSEDEISDSFDHWLDHIHNDEISLFKNEMDLYKTVSPDISSHFSIEYRMKHKDGSVIWVLTRGIVVYDDDGKAIRMVGSQTDITMKKKAEDQLGYDALHDKLTSLPNRALFTDRLTVLYQHARRHANYKFAVLFIDLDRLKYVNDSLGHTAGDEVLIKVSNRIKSCLRENDTLARLGGDEFTVLLDGIENKETTASTIASRIQVAISKPLIIGGAEISITASIGINVKTEGYSKPEDLLRDADTAMYNAKMKGKSRQEVFSTEMHVHAVARLNLEIDLRQALEKEQFELHYQPIITLADGKVSRVEALIRWNHPQRGMIPPLDFIPLAEESDLILKIGEWVIRSACNQSNAWVKKKFPRISIAINISPHQFQYFNLVKQMRKIIQDTGANAFTLEIEITESAAMVNVEQSIKILREIQDMGLHISIDDFGIGYSSLGCLKLFPINSLKIDRSFLVNVPQNADNRAITASVIAIAHNLGLKVTAEGVENIDQLNFLRKNGCDEAQGFLFCRPASSSDITEFMQKHLSGAPITGF